MISNPVSLPATWAHEDDDTEATSREKQVDPRLDVTSGNIVPWGDNASLVQTAVKLHNDLPGAVIVDDLEFTNVACGG
jgi:hypothetical protein